MSQNFEVVSIQRAQVAKYSSWWRFANFSLVILAAVLVLGLAVWTMRGSENALRSSLRSKFGSILNVECEAVHDWVESKKQLANYVAADSKLVELLTIERSAESVDFKAEVNAQLQRVVERLNCNTCLLMTVDGEVLASSGDPWLGQQLPLLEDQFCETLLAGKSVASPVFKPVLRDPIEVGQEAVPSVIVVAAPINHPELSTIGFLGIGLDINEELSPVLVSSRMGVSGETIAVDEGGWILTKTRETTDIPRLQFFEDTSRQGYMANTSIDLTGRVDHRGKRVMSARRWLPELGICLVNKMDFDEAAAPVSRVRAFLWTLVGLLALTTLSTFVYRWYVFRLRNAARMSEFGRKKLGPYELEGKVGEGGMGVVYRAKHDLLRRPTAVKILPPDKSSPRAIERFEREVQFTSQLKHPNTISIYDYGRTENGLFYYAMELLDGINLEQLIQMEQSLSDGRVLHVLRQVCHSLAEAHNRDLVHRDIKPANIMLCDRGGAVDTVKVLDFGMVRARRENHEYFDGTLSGTPVYMAPEAFVDPKNVDPRVDVFAVGAVGFFLLTGRPIFEANTLSELLKLHESEIEIDTWSKLKIQSDSGERICYSLMKLIARCVATNPDIRYSSIDEVLEDLESCEPVQPWNLEAAQAWWKQRKERESTQRTTEKSVPVRYLAKTQAFRPAEVSQVD